MRVRPVAIAKCPRPSTNGLESPSRETAASLASTYVETRYRGPSTQSRDRIRHVKCGEEKPECKQCINTGRKCDGYKAASQSQLRTEISQSLSRRTWPLDPERHLVLLPGSREERRYIHFFSTQATQALSGFFPSEFWIQSVPQLSHHLPVIRHAVAAIGAVYERQAHGLPLPTTEADPGKAEHFELQQYNKAIHEFIAQLSSPIETDISIILITCTLFICIEMLRTNKTRAMNHVQCGLQILAKHLQDGKTVIRHSSDRELVQLFHRLNIQVSFFGRPLLQLDGPTENPTTAKRLVFDHICQARECLTGLVNRALLFIRQIGYSQRTLSGAEHQQKLLGHQRLLQEFCSWNAAFELMKTKSAKRVGISDARAPLVLWIEFHSVQIWLKGCVSPAQSYYDRFFTEFDLIVSSAEKVIELGAGPDLTDFPSRFALDAEVVPSMYWTASRCRDPMIRRRAIEAMRNYPTREGMWDKRRYVEAATKIVEFEEAQYSSLAVAERIPEERCRVHETLLFSEAASYASPCPVLFLWKPYGLNSEFEQYRDEV